MSTEAQQAATAKLDAAIRECWAAYGEDFLREWTRTDPADVMVVEWAVVVGSMGNDEGQVDVLLPHFPAVPHHHLKGLLVEALDTMREG